MGFQETIYSRSCILLLDIIMHRVPRLRAYLDTGLSFIATYLASRVSPWS